MSTNDDKTRVFDPASVTETPEQLVGSVLAGRYKILQLLGVGAMGAVYLGQHLKIGRKDAIKVLHHALARDPDAIARFDRGARNVGAIRHPNVCTIYDFSDTDNGLQYLAMEYVPGAGLNDLLAREGALPVERSLRIAEQVAEALQAAHNVGIVHRDLKPANIMIAPGPDGHDIVKVVDFDISKGSSEGVEAEVTRLGYVVGTPEYMSPEQLWGGKLDGRSDVYSLALVLYRMLTGKLPFQGDLQEIMSARLTDAALLPLDQLAPGKGFPPELQDVLKQALRHKAEQRTASAAAFAAQLRAMRGAPASPTEQIPSTRVVAARAPLNKGALAALGATVLVLALVATKVMTGAEAGTELPADSIPVSSTTQVDSPRAPAANNAPTNAPATPGGTRRQQSVPEQQAVPTETATAMSASRATELLGDFRTRLAGETPPPSVLRGMRDSAIVIYDIDDVPALQRGIAAFVVAYSSAKLGEPAECSKWAARLRTQTPESRLINLLQCENP